MMRLPWHGKTVPHAVLDVPPYRRKDGRIEYCEDCPGAIMKNGKLCPLCLSDIDWDGEK